MDQLDNFIKMRVQAGIAALSTTRIGTISSYDPTNHAVKVLIQPDNIESGWMPLATAWAGNGWGMVAAPVLGAQVKIHAIDGNLESAIVGQSCYSDQDRSPGGQSGEYWLVHQSGSLIKILNDGSLVITANTNLPITVGGNLTINVMGNVTANVQGTTSLTSSGAVTATAPSFNFKGNVTVNGTIIATGDITDNNGAHGTLENIRTVYNSHTHGSSPTPLPQLS